MLQATLKLIFGSKFERDVKKMQPMVAQVNAMSDAMSQLSDAELQAKTIYLKQRLKNKETLDQILPEAFAVAREASFRSLKMRHFDVQLMGGIVLHNGSIAEMKTGEGKTLTSTLTIYLNALLEKGVHVVTVNDYLAKRDAEWMGPLYKFLGLSVGFITANMPHEKRREAYACDITYGTNNEFGFDYLRDNMVEHKSLRVQRGHYYAIVDEVDSILIDEARTPLIISGAAEQSSEIYVKVNRIVPQLRDKEDYDVDEKARNVLLTEMGVAKVEKLLGIENLYDPSHVDLVHHVHQSLKAHTLFQRDVDYVVQNSEVIIVDEFTGRLMEGRRYSDGLHQAIEAKEKVDVKEENQTMATITFQNYFRMYEKLAGMTGTADTEAEEFKKIYNLDVSVLPTHRNMIRIDYPDKVYRTVREKFEAIVEEVKACHLKGQPVLLGTVSIENSEKLSKMLQIKGIPHAVLNAKYHEKEAEIIKDAGKKSRVTIATNMAGRGTDIVLGEGVVELGGLHIIGSERHESRRIDNQLRGRSGRQGDPGSSRFYLSLEDDLMRIFGSDRIAPIMQRLGMQEGEAIEHKMVSNAIERAQKRVEGHNFEVRKHLLEYDDVMNKQRQYIYKVRNQILDNENIHELVEELMHNVLDQAITNYAPSKNYAGWDLTSLKALFEATFSTSFALDEKQASHISQAELYNLLLKRITEAYQQKTQEVSEDNMVLLEKMVALQVIDQKWKEHLYAIDHLKEGIWTMGYAERNPIVEYRFQSFALFEQMVTSFHQETIEFIFKAQVDEQLREEVPEFHEIGRAIHSEIKSYGVSRDSFATTEDLMSSVHQARQNGNLSTTSKAATQTAGGATKRKSSRRKK